MAGAALLLSAWSIVAPLDWTLAADDPAQNVRVVWQLSEGGVAGPVRWWRLGAGEALDVPSDPELDGSGRTVCLTAYSQLVVLPSVRSVDAVLCHRYPLLDELLPPGLIRP